MSRTRHNTKGPGCDFSARYNCDKGYGAGTGRVPKNAARRERRNNSKTIIQQELELTLTTSNA